MVNQAQVIVAIRFNLRVFDHQGGEFFKVAMNAIHKPLGYAPGFLCNGRGLGSGETHGLGFDLQACIIEGFYHQTSEGLRRCKFYLVQMLFH